MIPPRARKGGSFTVPETTLTGPPPDIAGDPDKLKIYEAIQDGINDANGGRPNAAPVDLTGDETTAQAYDAGYHFAKGELPLPPPPAELKNWYSGPMLEEAKGGEPYPYDPALRAIEEWLGLEEDPHIENAEFPTDTTEPPGAGSGPGD